MLNSVLKPSSTWKFFREECEFLKEIFARLCYPENLVKSGLHKWNDQGHNQSEGRQAASSESAIHGVLFQV